MFNQYYWICLGSSRIILPSHWTRVALILICFSFLFPALFALCRFMLLSTNRLSWYFLFQKYRSLLLAPCYSYRSQNCCSQTFMYVCIGCLRTYGRPSDWVSLNVTWELASLIHSYPSKLSDTSLTVCFFTTSITLQYSNIAYMKHF